MNLFEVFLIALALSMDAFAVAVGKGLTWMPWTLKKALIVGLWFGTFQAIMPAIGYYAGALFAGKIEAISHWVAFGLLALIGGKMVFEGLKKDKDEQPANEKRLGVKEMFPLAVATSIDALAAGVAFSMQSISIAPAVLLIGLTTCVLSAAGTKIGQLFGSRYQSIAEVLGGVILILMGLKSLLEHLEVLQF